MPRRTSARRCGHRISICGRSRGSSGICSTWANEVAMPLHGHVYRATSGLIGFDADRAIKPAVAAAFFKHGYRFCVRYVRRDKAHSFDLSAGEAEAILEVGLGLM